MHYLAWGEGAPLILVHGLADNPHLFADLAPAFSDRFSVIAYARRGHGRSEDAPPYDTGTLTDDLCRLMDGLNIAQADVAGYSMGGNEVTGMATRYPDRVRRIVYLDAAYDYADPDFETVLAKVPPVLRTTPRAALRSLSAYQEFYRAEYFAGVPDLRRVEQYILETVNLEPDGSVRPKMMQAVAAFEAAMRADARRDYSLIRCPVLAIYAESSVNVKSVDDERRLEGLAWDFEYMQPFKGKSIRELRRALPEARFLTVAGGHNDFLLTSRTAVIEAMREFLLDG